MPSKDGNNDSQEDSEDPLDLSHGTFDQEINFAENQLQEMEVEVNQAIIKLQGGDLRNSGTATAAYQSSRHESIDQERYK